MSSTIPRQQLIAIGQLQAVREAALARRDEAAKRPRLSTKPEAQLDNYARLGAWQVALALAERDVCQANSAFERALVEALEASEQPAA